MDTVEQAQLLYLQGRRLVSGQWHSRAQGQGVDRDVERCSLRVMIQRFVSEM